MKSHNHQGPSVDTGLGLRAVRKSLPQAAPWFMEGLLTMSRGSFTGRVLPQPLLPSPPVCVWFRIPHFIGVVPELDQGHTVPISSSQCLQWHPLQNIPEMVTLRGLGASTQGFGGT